MVVLICVVILVLIWHERRIQAIERRELLQYEFDRLTFDELRAKSHAEPLPATNSRAAGADAERH